MTAMIHAVWHVAWTVFALIGLGCVVMTGLLIALVVADRREHRRRHRACAMHRHPAAPTDWDAAFAALIAANPPEEH